MKNFQIPNSSKIVSKIMNFKSIGNCLPNLKYERFQNPNCSKFISKIVNWKLVGILIQIFAIRTGPKLPKTFNFNLFPFFPNRNYSVDTRLYSLK